MEIALASKLPRGVGKATKYYIGEHDSGIGVWSNKVAFHPLKWSLVLPTIHRNKHQLFEDKPAAPKGAPCVTSNFLAIDKPDPETFLPVYSLHSKSVCEWGNDSEMTVAGVQPGF